MFQDIDDEPERDGFTLRARIEYDEHMGAPWEEHDEHMGAPWEEHDEHMGAPWEEHDGHGPVSDWTRRDKRPGELILCDDGRQKRFYDFAEACRIARRDGWNAAPYDVPGETPRQRAAKAAMADFEHLRGWCNDQWNWCNDQWNWCGVVVTASRAGVELGRASLWGIESDAGSYLVETANELAGEALAEAAAKVREIAA